MLRGEPKQTTYSEKCVVKWKTERIIKRCEAHMLEEKLKKHQFFCVFWNQTKRNKWVFCVMAQRTSLHLSNLISWLKWATVPAFCLAEKRYIWLLWKETPLLLGEKKGLAAASPCMTPASPNPQITPTPCLQRTSICDYKLRSSMFLQRNTAHTTHCCFLDLLCPRCISPTGRYQVHLWIEIIIASW